jgi:hypothetical protein
LGDSTVQVKEVEKKLREMFEREEIMAHQRLVLPCTSIGEAED